MLGNKPIIVKKEGLNSKYKRCTEFRKGKLVGNIFSENILRRNSHNKTNSIHCYGPLG